MDTNYEFGHQLKDLLEMQDKVTGSKADKEAGAKRFADISSGLSLLGSYFKNVIMQSLQDISALTEDRCLIICNLRP